MRQKRWNCCMSSNQFQIAELAHWGQQGTWKANNTFYKHHSCGVDRQMLAAVQMFMCWLFKSRHLTLSIDWADCSKRVGCLRKCDL